MGFALCSASVETSATTVTITCHSGAAAGNYSNRRTTRIEIVKRSYDNSEDALRAIEVDVCAFSYNGRGVFATNRARAALTTGRICAPIQHSLWREPKRLIQCCADGFALWIPDLQFEVNANDLALEGENCITFLPYHSLLVAAHRYDLAAGPGAYFQASPALKTVYLLSHLLGKSLQHSSSSFLLEKNMTWNDGLEHEANFPRRIG